jgi:hypothetical protein
MLNYHGWFTLIAIISLGFIGCSKPAESITDTDGYRNTDTPRSISSDSNTPRDISKLEPPAAACYAFLDAVCKGDDEKAANMLTSIAREKTAAFNMRIAPKASDTARFTIGRVKYIGEDGAQVATTISDIDEDGQRYSQDAFWVLRLEKDGWRIAGVAETIFPGEPPLVKNFEDPEEMLKKEQWVTEEIRRRANKGENSGGVKENFQAKDPDNTENTMFR